MRRPLLLAGAAVGCTIVAFGIAAYADDEPDDASEWTRVVDDAREQMAAQAFDGVVAVEWHEGGGTHRAHMRVRQHDGMVEIVNADRVVATDAERVLLDGQAWITMGGAHGRAPRLTAGKYDVVDSSGPNIAGHTTTRYEAVRDGHAVERLYVDDASGLVLRREVLDDAGDVARAVSFSRLELDPEPTTTSTTGPTTTSTTGPTTGLHGRRPSPVGNLDGPFHDPARVGEGFRLLGRWTHRDDLAQLYYSDGVLSVSVFEQPGRLAWSALPPGGVDAEIDGHRARRYALPAGEAWVFERDGIVYTFVGDATPTELAAIAHDVSRPEQNRLERLAEMVVGPFRW